MAARSYIVWLLLGVLVCAFAGYASTRELATARDLHESSYVTAAQCARCHPDHTRSFERTFHRTMTQRASAESVLGKLDASLDYFGVRSRMQRAQGAFTLDYQLPGQAAQHFQIEKTIGSRRYQQYVARRGDELV